MTDFHEHAEKSNAQGKTTWALTVGTLLVLAVAGGVLGDQGKTEAAVVVAGALTLWAILGIGTLAGRAITNRSGSGYAFVSVLVCILVIPAAAAAVVLLTGASEVGDALEGDGDSGSGNAYLDCLAEPDNTVDDCADFRPS